MHEKPTSLAYLEKLVCPQNPNSGYIRGIHVVPPRGPDDASRSPYSYCNTAHLNPNAFVWSKSTISEHFVTLFRMLIQRIPKGNMKRFM